LYPDSPSQAAKLVAVSPTGLQLSVVVTCEGDDDFDVSLPL
jgi:hypothetical protein